MRAVVLDTNALLMPFEVKLNLDLEIRRLVGNARVVVPGPMVGELKRCGAKHSKAAISLARKYEIIHTEKDGDEAIIELATKLDAFVVTNDKELRSRLRALKIPLIYLRSGTHAVLEEY